MYRDNLEVNGPWITQHFPNLTAACVSGEAPDATRFQEMVGISYVAVLVRCIYWALATMSSSKHAPPPAKLVAHRAKPSSSATWRRTPTLCLTLASHPNLTIDRLLTFLPSRPLTCLAVGYGNAPIAHSTLDYLYSLIVQVSGACLSAAIFSNVAQMINQGESCGANSRPCFYPLALTRVWMLQPSPVPGSPWQSPAVHYHQRLSRIALAFHLSNLLSLPSPHRRPKECTLPGSARPRARLLPVA